MGAAKNEKCGWCAFTVPEGALICGHCGARREIEIKDTPGAGIYSLLAGLIIGACSGAVLAQFIGVGNWLILLGAAAGAVLCWDTKTEVAMWYRD